MDNMYKMPFYAKVALIFIAAFAFVYTMYIGKTIIIPIVYALLVAILLNPLVNYLTRKKVNKILAISMAVLLAIIAVVVVLYIASSQITMFSEMYPQLKIKFDATSTELVHWISKKFTIRHSKINTWIRETESEELSNFAYGERLAEIGQMIVIGTLLPVYLFMILFYKSLLLEFIRNVFQAEHHNAVAQVLVNTKRIVQSYLVGLFFEMVIMSVLNSAALLLIGIDYAIILGVSGAIVNIVPYLGGIIAIALPMIVAFVTKDSSSYQ